MGELSIWWIGNRAYELKGCEPFFAGGIAIVGCTDDTDVPMETFENFSGKRIDYNNPKWDAAVDNFLAEKIGNIIKEMPGSRFFWHTQLNFNQKPLFISTAIYNNSVNLINKLRNKAFSRQLFSNDVDVIPCIKIPFGKCNYSQLKKMFPQSDIFVVQSKLGAGGHTTYVVSEESFNPKINLPPDELVLVSVYYSKMLAINQHVIVNSDEILCLPPSVQLIEKDAKNRLVYRGGDYSSISMLGKDKLSKVEDASNIIGNKLAIMGYKGCVGIDFLIDDMCLYFVELNPRFQSSTRLLNECLLAQNLPSVYKMHILSHIGEPIPNIKHATAEGAFYYTSNIDSSLAQEYNQHRMITSPDTRNTPFSKDQISLNIECPKSEDTIWVEPSASDCRIGVNRGIVAYSPEQGGILNKSITHAASLRPKLIPHVWSGDLHSIAKFKFELFCFGMRIDETAKNALRESRVDLTIRDGIAGGLEIWFCGNVHVNVPIKEFFSLISPYRLIHFKNEEQFAIVDQYKNILPVQIAPLPNFVGKYTSSGTSMVDVGQMMLDRLSLEVVHGCIYNKSNKLACKFCELGAENQTIYRNINDIRELIIFCRDSPNSGMRHILLGGSTPPLKKWDFFLEVLELINSCTSVPIYMMIAPPKNLSKLKILNKLGLDEIGINIEFFNRSIAKRIMPGKGSISIDYYAKALGMAVDLWGDKGAVRSILIVGIEPLQDTLRGVEYLASRGVLPILSPFRPIPGTPLYSHPPAASELLYESWARGQEIAEKHHLTLGPTCIACKNNTISLPCSSLDKYY